MSERVYPRDSPTVSGELPNSKTPLVESPPVSGQHHRSTSQESFTSSKMSYPGGYAYGGGPPPGTYVVQVPKDHIYRVPPPENAHKYKLYTQKKTRSNRCRCCFCSILIGFFVLVVAVGVLYLIYNPKAPSYSVESVQIKGVNLSAPASPTGDATISPVFNVTVKTENRNNKIGVYYQQKSSVKVYHNGVNLCDGSLPAFYQPPKNVTVFSTELSGSGIVLSKSARDNLSKEQKAGKVPLNMDVEVPVKIKFGVIKTWTITVKVSCEITVNALTEKAKVVSKSCKANAKPW